MRRRTPPRLTFVAATTAFLMAFTGVALASDVNVAVVDVTVPANAVTLAPGGSANITINMSVTGNQAGTATFEVLRDWALSGGTFTGSNAQEFTVAPRSSNDPPTTFSTTGTVTVAANQAVGGPFTLAVGAFDITNSNLTGAKLSAGNPSNYQVTVQNATPTCTAASVTTNPSHQTITYGENASFTAAGGGSPSPTVQWQVSTDGGPFTNIQNETSTTLSLTKPSVASSGNQYQAVFTNQCNGTKTATTTAATMTVNPATVNVTASSHNVTYGDAAPAITPSYSDFVTGETSDVLTTQPTCSTEYDQGDGVSGSSPYPSSCSGAAAANYTFTYTGGSVTVDPASLTIRASSPTVTYGDPVPNVTPSYLGFVLNDDEDNLTTPPTCGTTYTEGAGAGGSYTTSCSGAVAANYSIGYQNGTVTVDKKQLTVTAANKSIHFGQSDPAFTFTYSNDFVGHDSASDIDTAPTCGVSGAHAAVGSYDIVCSGGLDNNYSFSYVKGTLTVQAWNLSGFYSPVDMNGVLNVVKAGSTVPLKFEVFAGAVGQNEQDTVAAIKSFTQTKISCSTLAGTPADDIENYSTGGTSLRYDSTAGQFIQNWKVPTGANLCYRVLMTTQDNSALTALFRTK